MKNAFRTGLPESSSELDAKLHQGYDPSSEFNDNGLLFSAVQFTDGADADHGKVDVITQTESVNNSAFLSDGNGNINPGSGAIFENSANNASFPASVFDANALLLNNGAYFGDNDTLLGFSGYSGGASGAELGGFNRGYGLGDGFGVNNERIGGTGGGGGDPIPDPNDPPTPAPPGLLAPTLTTGPVSGNEGTPISLNIGVTSQTPGSTISILITNVPVGAILSAGIDNGNGTWTLTQAQLAGLTLTPPADYSGPINLGVIATASLNGQTAAAAGSEAITVEGVATPPNLNAADASGNEGTPIPLSINASLNDTDGSETLSITISNVPAGATLNHGINNGGGVWTLTPAQLVGLTITPPPGFSGPLQIVVTATSAENGTTSSVSDAVDITVTGVATTPNLNATNVTGNEDTPIALNISSSLVDNDGSESLSITISNVPVGATLSAGINNGGGVWTLTPAQLVGLTLTPPNNFSGAINLTATATSTENSGNAALSDPFTVTVTPVADNATLNVVDANGAENTPIALNITASLNDTDGSETLSITIANVPVGAVFNQGINNGNGTWSFTPAQLVGLTITTVAGFSGDFNLSVWASSTDGASTATVMEHLEVVVSGVATPPTLVVLPASGDEDTAIALDIDADLVTPSGGEILSIIIGDVPPGATLSAGIDNGDGTWTLTEAELIGLTITPPLNYSGTIDLTVTAIETDGGSVGVNSEILSVTVDGVADAADLFVNPSHGDEGQPTDLDISASLFDNDGSETLVITIANVPPGAVLNHGINNGGGVWTLTPAQLVGLTITTPPGFSGALQLSVTATSSENGTSESVSTDLDITIAGVASPPILSVTASASGNEDTAIALTISSSLVDNDGSESLSIVISNVPAGAVLSAGLYSGNGVWTLTPAQLAGLTMTPPLNYSGTINLTVTAVATEQDGNHAETALPCAVVVTPVPDAPNLTVHAVSGAEDSMIALDIQSMLNDTDGSEILTVQISGVPAGATLSAGTNLGGGVWSLTAAQLTNLRITPPNDSDANFTLTVTAIARETANNTTATTLGSIAVNVLGSADVPDVHAHNSGTLLSNTAVDINVTGSLNDTDGSETLSFIIDGVPDGFALNHGSNNGDNSWTVTAAQMAGLKIVAPFDFEGTVHLRAIAVANDSDGSVVQSAPDDFTVYFVNPLSFEINVFLGIGISAGIGLGVGVGIGVNLGDLLSPDGIVAMEGSTIQIADGPGLVVAILGLLSYLEFSGVPIGATFNHGTNMGGGVWRMNAGDLNNLSLTLLPDSDNDFVLTFSARLITLINLPLSSTIVHVVGVADLPSVSAGAAIGAEDSGFIPISISAALTDTDVINISETLSITIKDLPPGFTLSAGINNGDGSWTLTPAQLVGLGIRPSANFSGNVNYTIVATATEREGDSSIHTITGSLQVNAVADAPIIQAALHNVVEDINAPLNFGISLADNDGSESIIAVTISGLPAGASLLNATDNGNGTWSVNPANIGIVQFVPPAHWHGDVTLNVSTTSQESVGGSTATTNGSLVIHVAADADAPNLSVADALGDQGTDIALNLSASLVDNDGSEYLSIVISDVPDGSSFSAGLNNGDGSWTFNASQLVGLTYSAPYGFTGDVDMIVTAYAREGSNNDVATTQSNFSVHVDPVMGFFMMFSMMGAPNDGNMMFMMDSGDGFGVDDGGSNSFSADSGDDGSITPVPPADSGSDYDSAFSQPQSG